MINIISDNEKRRDVPYPLKGDTVNFKETTLSDAGILDCLLAVKYGQNFKDYMELDRNRELYHLDMQYFIVSYNDQATRDKDLQIFKEQAIKERTETIQFPQYCGTFDCNSQQHIILKAPMALNGETRGGYLYKGVIVNPQDYLHHMENTQEKIGEQVDATKESLSGKAFLSSQKSADVLSSDKLIQHPYLDQLETINVINKESFDIDFTPDNAFLIQLGLFMDAAKGKQSDMVSFDGEKKVFRLYFETERSDFVAAVREHMAKQSRPIIDEDDQDKELNDMFDYFFKQLEKRIQYVQS